MQILFKPRHPKATDSGDLTQRQAHTVLRRLGRLEALAEVRRPDVNGRRGRDNNARRVRERFISHER